MTKLKFFLVVAMTWALTVKISAQYQRDSAINLVLNHLLINDSGHVNIYASLDPKSGSTGLPLFGDDTISYPFSSNWVFFVDDFPYARWNHPCRYIFIDAVTGMNTINTDKHIYPSGITQEFEVLSAVPPPDSCSSIYLQPDPVTLNGLAPNPHLFAVIIGGYEDLPPIQPQAWNDISAVYTTLKQVYGYQTTNMFVHYYKGFSPIRGNDLDGGLPSEDIDYAAYKDTIYHTFRCLAGEETDPLIPKLQPDDQLLVYVDDHGDGSVYHSWVMLPQDPLTTNPDKNLYDSTLSLWVKDIQCGQMIFLLEQCFSGGFQDDLQTKDSDKCKNRSIYTSVSRYQKEYMDFYVSDTAYGEFIFYWTAAARGYFPDIKHNKPWLTGFPVYDTVLYPIFPYNSCFGTCNNHPYYDPDVDADGFVTMEEAFDYANDYNSQSDTGFNCPYNPVHPNHSAPQRYKNISFQEDLQSLSGLTGKITHTQTVANRSYVVGGPLTIDENSTLSFNAASQDTAKVYFVNDSADLTVNFGSQLNMVSGMIFGGQNQSQINIYGSINLINNVTFKSITPGTYFAGLYLNNQNLQSVLNHVRFKNAGLFSNGINLRIINGSIFENCKQLISNNGNVNISNSFFNGTSLYLNNQSHPHNSSLTDSIFNNIIIASANHDAVNINNYNNFSIQNNAISGASTNYSGLGLFYSGIGATICYHVENNSITNCQTGITGYNSNAIIRNNHVFNNNIGIKSVNFSNLKLIGAQINTPGNVTQIINNNSSYEIYSYFDLPYLRYNKIFDDNDFSNCLIYVETNELDLLTPITFDVRYNCWKNNSIPSQLCSVYGSGATFNYLPYFCLSNIVSDTIEDPEEDMYNTGDSLFSTGNFNDAKDMFISLIEQYPQTRYAQSAMKQLLGVERYTTNDYLGLKQFYLSNDSIVADTTLSRIGEFLANRCDVVLEDLESAIVWYEDAIQAPNSPEDSIFAIIDLEDIYLQMDNVGNKATHVGRLQQFVPSSAEEYSSYRDSLLALIPFDHNKDSGLGKTIKGLKPGELVQNQPNPFTTTTDIYYRLGSNCSRVELKITDILGRIRKKILLTANTVGVHKVEFNPEELHSGVYQYSLVVDGNLLDTKKMIFIK